MVFEWGVRHAMESDTKPVEVEVEVEAAEAQIDTDKPDTTPALNHGKLISFAPREQRRQIFSLR